MDMAFFFYQFNAQKIIVTSKYSIKLALFVLTKGVSLKLDSSWAPKAMNLTEI